MKGAGKVSYYAICVSQLFFIGLPFPLNDLEMEGPELLVVFKSGYCWGFVQFHDDSFCSVVSLFLKFLAFCLTSYCG